jgi:protein-S-isoprenylcysteine O-methyltransferase Ste14
MSRVGPRPRCLSDWIGFFCFSGLAVSTVSKMSAIGLLMIPTLAFDLLVAVTFLIRVPPRASLREPRARLTAYGGTFLILVFIQLARRWYPHWLAPSESGALRPVGALLWINGLAWALYSIWYLRHAFSVEPQARRLITCGPYRVARHPVYLGYLVQYVGMWLLFPTFPFGVALLAWVLATVDRMHHEERVLSEAFPEYAEYRRRVGALGIRLHRLKALNVNPQLS